MMCESLFVRVQRGMTTTKMPDSLVDPQHPLPLLSLGQINNLHSPFYISISEETKAHDEHTHARSLTIHI